MKTILFKILFYFLLSIGLFLQSCQKDEPTQINDAASYSADVANKWYEEALYLTKKTPGFAPPIASRAFGYMGVALYETVMPGMSGYQSLNGKLNMFVQDITIDQDKNYHWGIAANTALAYMVKNLYGNMSESDKDAVNALESQIFTELGNQTDGEIVYNSVIFGRKIAERVFDWSKTDGGHEAYLHTTDPSYVPPVGEGFWVPTAPAFAPALLPHWGDVRPFIPNSISASQPAMPMPYSTNPESPFFSQAKEVYDVSQSLTAEQTLIAKYWADGGNTITPPGHSIAILEQLLVKEESNLATAAESYCKLSIALADAFISCWKCKYIHSLVRPITFIQENISAGWMPLVPTPPFPEYTSGHSVQSGAMAAVLSDIFGSNYAFTDASHANRTDIDGTPRQYSSFDEAANEAAISRLYGGIHYTEAIELGVAQGKVIGEAALALPFKQ